MKLQWIVSVFLFLATSAASARPNFTLIDEYFHALKDLPMDLRSHGPLCEQMARLQMERIYSDDEYDLKVGIIYWNDTRIVGELDLVIFRKSDNEAVVVGEVKCQRRMARARHHAEEQLQRFATNIDRDQVREMYLSAEESEQFFPTSFDENPTRWTIGQKGALGEGFSHELELELDDILFLQRRLNECQNYGRCS